MTRKPVDTGDPDRLYTVTGAAAAPTTTRSTW